MTPGLSDLRTITRAMRDRGYVVFDDPGGYDLNIVGIRTEDLSADTFNDFICVFYRLGETWPFFAFPATTDPGTYYRESPANVRGTAAVKPGQYRGMWQVGKHQGKYKALVQRGPVTVYRDANRDGVLNVAGVGEETGLFGINCHRARGGGPSGQVGKWSAGCQVLQDDAHFDFLMGLCDRGTARFGNSFSYTLLSEGEL